MNYINFIIGIKNAVKSRRKEVVSPFSKLNKEIGKVLVKEGFLNEIKEENVDGKKMLKAQVKYDRRLPILTDVLIISKPSLRVYKKGKSIQDIEKKGRKILILSTNQGVMTGKDARKKGIGGEILFAIW